MNTMLCKTPLTLVLRFAWRIHESGRVVINGLPLSMQTEGQKGGRPVVSGSGNVTSRPGKKDTAILL